ncbi:MAG: DUF89 family protein [Thermoplasmata archaeon]|nr:DUF89 family protein [Thermoplasmata archaeon]RLF28189.1 MAG: hypothetical protein DRN01_00600 [Thermoplasmata archaeon]
MKTYLDCIPCFLTQSLEAARMSSDDEETHKEVLKKVMHYLQTISFDIPPPETSREVHHIIRQITDTEDPYRKVKDQANRTAEKLYPTLKKMVIDADDPLLMAIKLAIVGNVIDFGTTNRFNINDMIKIALKHEHISNEAYRDFVETLDNAETVLYIADNCGEIYFDKLLLEELSARNKKITYVVRANPIINDVTLEDAKTAGIDGIAEVIAADEGSDKSAPGILLKYASPVFLEKLDTCDMVISKGQGNYESLSDVNRRIFFLLVVKCPLVSRDIKEDVGKMVLKVKN